jgi:hypothetical protein
MTIALRITCAVSLLSAAGCRELWTPWLDERPGCGDGLIPCAEEDFGAPESDGALPSPDGSMDTEPTAWAVGFNGVVLYRSPSGWKPVQPKPTSRNLLRVWGVGGTNSEVFAVGNEGTIVHLRDGVWSVDASGTQTNLTAVFGFSRTQVFAAAGANILTYNGTAWSSTPTLAAGVINGLYGIPSMGTAWAVTNRNAPNPGEFLSSSGGNWGAPAFFEAGVWMDVWASSPSAIWVAGWAGRLRYWNGSAWTPHTSCAVNAAWSSIFGLGSDVYAVGTFDPGTGMPSATIARWTGPANAACMIWQPATQPVTFLDIHGTSATNLFVVGTKGTIMRWDGSKWASEASGTTEDLWGVWTAN